MIYIDLILNLSLLVSLSIVSGFIEKRRQNHPQWINLIQGFLFGAAAVLGMLRPLNLGPGLIFDGRSVMVSLCAMFFGPWSALVAGSMTIACRIGLGGMGAVTGVSVILSSLGIGLLAHYRMKPRNEPPTVWTLYLFGIAVHIAMLALMFTLPGGAGLTVLKQIGLPVILLYPLATVLTGKILSDQLEASQRMLALQESEKRYRLLVETANEGIWAMDGDHRTTFVNQAMADMMGYLSSEMIGKKVEDFFFPEDIMFHKQRMQMRHACKDEVYERRFKKRDGSPLWTNVSAKALQDDQGRFIGSFAMFTDITERKKTEEKLLESKANLNALFDAVNESIFLMEPDGTVVALNKTTATRLGLDNTDVTGQNMFDFLPTDVAEKRRAYVEQIITTGKPERFEDQRDGKWIDNSIFPIMDENGKVRRLAIFGLDITRHKLGEEALRKSEESVRAKLEAILSPEGDIGSLNLADIIDAPSIQTIMDDFFRLTQIGVGLLDINGKVLVATGWQDICTKFHRVHPKTCRNCIESDTLLSSGIQPGSFKTYKCKNNMWDIATPIHVGGRHLGNLFLGQFFYEDDKPDYEAFRDQARKFGFNEDEYLDALNRVPRWRRETLECVMSFYTRLAQLISSLSYSNIKLARILKQNEQAEKALQRKNNMLARTENIAHIGSWEWDIATDTVTWSDELFRIFQRDPAEGAPSFTDHPEFYHPDDMRQLEVAVEAAVRSGTPYELELRLIRKDGETRFCFARGYAEMGPEGSAVRLFGSLQDVTERKQMELILKEKTSFLNILLESIPVPIFYKDTEGRYIGFNNAFHKFFGKDQKYLVGKTVFDIAPRELAEVYHAKDLELLQNPGVQIYETEMKDIQGHLHNVVYHKATFTDASGKVSGLIGAIMNITDRKILEDQLRQSQKMESVGRLAGGVAHDFNNMLMIIIGNTEIAMEETDPSTPVYANLKEIIAGAQRSAELTRQLLAFARKQTISPKVLHLNQLIYDMIRMLQRLIGEDIDLVWKPSSNLWPVRMDPSQIDQILVNLAVNARDAIHGVGNLTIETENIVFDESYCMTHAGFIPGEFVLLAVSDTGCGMEKESMEHLFEPFYTTKEMGKGTGLGLATIYGIVKQNDGFINVYSEPGKGTAFKIYLPRTQVADAVEPREVSQKPANGTETVLLVEDEPSILKLGKAVLDRYGYTVLSARTPEDALALAEQHPEPIHLLITDIVMPQMNGRELMKKITVSRPEIKTLYMSGYTADVIEHHGVLEKGIHFLQKPFSVKTIAAKVREVLDGSDVTG